MKHFGLPGIRINAMAMYFVLTDDNLSVTNVIDYRLKFLKYHKARRKTSQNVSRFVCYAFMQRFPIFMTLLYRIFYIISTCTKRK